MLVNKERMLQKMEEFDLDVIIASHPENVSYLADFQSQLPYMYRFLNVESFALFPRSSDIAPALIIVGCLMMSSVVKIEWTEFSEGLPAFLTIIIMPLSGFSITEGIAFGFISYTIVKIFSGRINEVHWLIILFAILFIVRYLIT